MPLSHESKLYAVSDAKVAKMTADPAGGSATYAALVDVPGIKEVGLGFDFKNVSLRGDNKELDSDTILVAVTLTFNHAKVSLDALPVFLGGTTTDSGTTPAQKAQYRRLGSDVMPSWKFEARTPTSGVDVIGGDAHLLVYKCKITDYSLGLAEEDYRILSASARGIARLADDFMWDLIENETQVAIA